MALLIFANLLAVIFESAFLFSALSIIGITSPTLFAVMEFCIFSYAYFIAFKMPRKKMLRMQEIVEVGAFTLIFAGVLLITMAIFAFIKFFVAEIFREIALLYLMELHVPLGIALVFSSIAYYEYGGSHYMSITGRVLAYAVTLAGLGYALEGLGILMWDALLLGIGVTFARIGITFYVILSIWFYSEIEGSRLGSISSVLLAVFALPEFWFVFSPEFYRTIPGITFMVLMGMMFLLQAYSLYRSTQGRKLHLLEMETTPRYILSPIGTSES